jgi:HAD superfamily hydrolase (TIGR01509 family)
MKIPKDELMKGLIFDLDGTLIDTVYAHVIAWQKAFALISRLTIPAEHIHQKIGMGGELLAISTALAFGKKISEKKASELDQKHSDLMKEILPKASALPGAVELLRELKQRNIPHGIATSSTRAGLKGPIKTLQISKETVIVCSEDVENAKPAPDLFTSCSEALGVAARDCFVIGDAVWDMLAARRAGILSIGLLSGGVSERVLAQAGAYRIYRDPLELKQRLFELGLE